MNENKKIRIALYLSGVTKKSDVQGRCPACLSNITFDQFVDETERKKFLETGLCAKCMSKIK